MHGSGSPRPARCSWQHDVQLDYYGKRLATCSSDRTAKVYDVVEGGERKQVADLKGWARLRPHPRGNAPSRQPRLPARRRHDGPVWQVAWAHPKFGAGLGILASCSYDRQIIVWKEHSPHQWGQIYQCREHEGSGDATPMLKHPPPAHVRHAAACVHPSVGAHSELDRVVPDGARSLPRLRLFGWEGERPDASRCGRRPSSNQPAIAPAQTPGVPVRPPSACGSR